MKKIFLISFILLFLFPIVSHSDWTKVSQTIDGAKYPATIYVDFERIRKGGGYVYFWQMMDYLEPLDGVLSDVLYSKADCTSFGFKDLLVNFHKGPMGQGELHAASGALPKDSQKWGYPAPNTTMEKVLETVCNSIK